MRATVEFLRRILEKINEERDNFCHPIWHRYDFNWFQLSYPSFFKVTRIDSPNRGHDSALKRSLMGPNEVTTWRIWSKYSEIISTPPPPQKKKKNTFTSVGWLVSFWTFIVQSSSQQMDHPRALTHHVLIRSWNQLVGKPPPKATGWKPKIAGLYKVGPLRSL